MEEGLETAARYFSEEVEGLNQEKAVYLEVQNESSQRRDRMAQKIETLFMLALSRTQSRFTIHQLNESLTGLSGQRAVLIKGSYQPQGKRMILRFSAIQSLGDGQVLGQTQVVVQGQKDLSDSLVAVLDLDTKDYNRQQRQIFTDIFRTQLRRAHFKIASSAEVDKMDPDSIQKATGCTRDECATVIGEQLGVDLVISLGYARMSEDLAYLSAKVISIEDGSILASETQETNGRARDLPQALRELADKLAGQMTAGRQVAPVDAAPAPRQSFKRQESKPSVEGKSSFFEDLVWVPTFQVGGPGLHLTYIDGSTSDFSYGNGSGFAFMVLQQDGWFVDLGGSSGTLQSVNRVDADGVVQLAPLSLVGTANSSHLNVGYNYHFKRLTDSFWGNFRFYMGLGSYSGDYTWQLDNQTEQSLALSGTGLQFGVTYTAWQRWLFGLMVYGGSGQLSSENQALLDSIESHSGSDTHLTVGYAF
ncbi:MAG: hypothetical protein RRB13_01985 [bacterium]|nr:hypothetical protein [bacterium]